MNIYEKLNLARCRFRERNIRKTGKNDFAKYTYFELEDILPATNAIEAEIKAISVVGFFTDRAVLRFVDCEKPGDFVEFTTPMSAASLKGCHEVQNLGAVESYLKRYLYQHCYEIAEADALDCDTGKPGQNPKNDDTDRLRREYAELRDSKDENGRAMFTGEDMNRFYALGKDRGVAAAVRQMKTELGMNPDKPLGSVRR